MPHFVGGTELYTQTVARYQVQLNHSVAIFTPSPEMPVPQRPFTQNDDDGVRIYQVPTGPQSRTQVFRNTFANKQLDAAFKAILAQENPDIIHIQHLMGLPTSLLDQVREAKIPYIITLHDYWYGCANAQLITNDTGEICAGPDKAYHNCGRCAIARTGKRNLNWMAPLVAPLMANRNRRLAQIITQANQVIAPTHFVKTIYEQMGVPTQNIIVIPHGIEIPHEMIDAILEKRPLSPENTLHIGYVGSIAKQKGIHNLIEAVNQLPHEGVQLTIYGGLDDFPDYVAYLRKIAQHPGIHFAGRVAREEIWEAYARFDILAMPTLWYEASPLTIQEAYAVKTPIIASCIGAMPEKITDGVDGILVPPGDMTALSVALLSLKNDPGKLAQLRSGIQPVRRIEDHINELTLIYQSIR